MIHHLNLAHGVAVAAFRASPAIGQIGPCLQLAPCYPADGSPAAAAAASAADTLENSLYLEPVLRSHYPSMSNADRRFVRGLDTAIMDGDLAVIATPVDFLGSITTRPWLSTVRVSRFKLIASPPPAGNRFTPRPL